jgi:hypothetical protein
LIILSALLKGQLEEQKTSFIQDEVYCFILLISQIALQDLAPWPKNQVAGLHRACPSVTLDEQY